MATGSKAHKAMAEKFGDAGRVFIPIYEEAKANDWWPDQMREALRKACTDMTPIQYGPYVVVYVFDDNSAIIYENDDDKDIVMTSDIEKGNSLRISLEKKRYEL